MNTVCFDGIQLFKEQFGTSYTYDENGNVTSVVDLQKQTTTYEYDTNNNLTEVIQDNKAKMTYTYDDYHNVLTATSEEGLVYTFVYDTWGNNTSVSIGSGDTKISSSAVYTEDGNRLVSTTDALGKITTYEYDADTNVLNWVKYPEDTDTTKTTYTYDSMYRMASAAVTTDTGLNLSASYTYEDDLLTKIQTASTTYNFTYGNFGLRSSVKVGTQALATYSYTQDGNNYLSSLDYGNGDKVQYEYDHLGRVTKQTYEDGDTVAYQYDNSGALATVTDSATGRKTTYYYDFTDRLMKYVETGTGYYHSVGYEYDQLNNLTSLVETINGTDYTTSYAYDDDNRVTSVTTNGTTVEYTYDAYGRISSQVTASGDTQIKTDSFSFKNPSETATSSQIAEYTVTSSGFSNTYAYDYDDNGNIQRITDSFGVTEYTYDSANQLIREDNEQLGFTYVWTYDSAGNILSRTEYAYTAGSLTGVTPIDTITYTYGNSEWGDLLTAYDGTAITYDEIGNPLSDGTWTYTWEHGRELVSMSDGSASWNFTYDSNGLRTKRTYGMLTYEYVYNGSQLTEMVIANLISRTLNTLHFSYDANGTPTTVTYNGYTYYYVTNIQGDVVAILNSSGTAVVTYAYDAWGNILSTGGSMASSLGATNPLRYRGYVYDQETSLYYLQSRYYNPQIGRFLNADKYFSGVGSKFIGSNMFAYCFNNPVNLSDTTGNWPEWIKGAIKAIVKYTIRPAIKTTQKLLSKVDRTYSTGISVSGTPSTVTVSAQIGISMDTKGNIAFQKSRGNGLTTGSASASIGVYQSVTNASSIDKLNGPSYQIGASAIVPIEGVPVYVGGDCMFIPNAESNTGYWGGTKTVGLALGEAGGEAHFEWSTTDTYQATYINFFDAFDMAYDIIQEW